MSSPAALCLKPGDQDRATDLSAFDDSKVRELADDPRRTCAAYPAMLARDGTQASTRQSSEEAARGAG